ncbi:hypothetical protein GALMADRAFT_1125602 [Galerina marginata CBS 339.88]|uniref:Uncharacterized protein n=1 Tax=Galerina marginata (strain CBS 339.88) TaxID=685588 RepID=A0A067TN23_GALM3|nr:hypothetical protein GALMADRAFT_1125602 [Galerina marginata CBS 339.88]
MESMKCREKVGVPVSRHRPRRRGQQRAAQVQSSSFCAHTSSYANSKGPPGSSPQRQPASSSTQLPLLLLLMVLVLALTFAPKPNSSSCPPAFL